MNEDFHDFEQAGWERAADQYGDAFGSLTSQTIPSLLSAAGAGKGTRLLDVASGPGYVAAAAAGMGASVVGVDFAAEMVARAARTFPGIEFVEGDAESLAFPDGRSMPWRSTSAFCIWRGRTRRWPKRAAC